MSGLGLLLLLQLDERALQRVEDLARTERLLEEAERRCALGTLHGLGVADAGEEDRLDVKAAEHELRDFDPVHRPRELDVDQGEVRWVGADQGDRLRT